MYTRKYRRVKKDIAITEATNVDYEVSPVTKLIPVDDECECAAILIHIWNVSHPQLMQSSTASNKEVRTANACFEHKMRHQKCPADCRNRDNLEEMARKRSKRTRKSFVVDDNEGGSEDEEYWC